MEGGCWEEVTSDNLRMGQIIKIGKFIDSQSNTPVNILPMCVASNRK